MSENLVRFRYLTTLILSTLLSVSVCVTADSSFDAPPAGAGVGADWGHFLGPNYNGVPMVDTFEPKAIELLWSKDIHPGASSMSIVDGKLYTMGNRDGREIIYCLDAQTGDEVWRYEYDSDLMPKLYAGGPNSTPTVTDGRVYTLSRKGQIFCLDAKTGDEIWQMSAEEWTPKGAFWGFSDSPVVWGGRVFANIGNRGLVLSADSGEIIWSSEDNVPTYATILPLPSGNTVLGVPAVVMQSCKGMEILDPATGESFLGTPGEWAQRKSNCNAVTPAIYQDSLLLMHSGHGLSRISRQGEQWVEDWLCKELIYDKGGWFTFNQQVIRNGHLYALAGNDREKDSRLACVNLETGEIAWQTPSPFGNLILVADKLVTVTQTGEIAWGDFDGVNYEEQSRQSLLNGGRGEGKDGPYWAHPVFHQGHLYVRSNYGKLTCFRFQ